MQTWGAKGGSKRGSMLDRRLKAFLPSTDFCFSIVCFLCNFWGSLGSLIGHLEALLGGLWTQKRVKTEGFLRFLKRLFEAPDGPLGLILAHSG